jgi:hypothetical protein
MVSSKIKNSNTVSGIMTKGIEIVAVKNNFHKICQEIEKKINLHKKIIIKVTLILGALMFLAGVIISFFKTSDPNRLVHFGRYSNGRYKTILQFTNWGLFSLFFSESLKRGLVSLQDIFGNILGHFSKIILVLSVIIFCKNFSTIDKFYQLPEGKTSEYTYAFHWGLLDVQSNKLNADFSYRDITKSLSNSLGGDGLHRPRWISWVERPLSGKINTRIYQYFGIANVNAFSFLASALVGIYLAFLIYSITKFRWLAVATTIFYLSCNDFHMNALIFHRTVKVLIIIPFLQLMKELHLFSEEPLDLMKSKFKKKLKIFFYMAVLLGLDEYGWLLGATIVFIYSYRHFKLDVHKFINWQLLKKHLPMILIFLTNIILIVILYFSTQPSFEVLPKVDTYDGPLNRRLLRLLRMIPFAFPYFTDTIFVNLGNYLAHIGKMRIYLMGAYAGIFCLFRHAWKNKQFSIALRNYSSVYLLFTLAIFATLMMTDWETIYPLWDQHYYNAPIAIGVTFYISLLVYSLRNNKLFMNIAFTLMAIFSLSNVTVFNSDYYDSINPSRINKILGPQLSEIRKRVLAGEVVVLPEKLEQLNLVKDFTKTFYKVPSIEIDAKETFPFYYYFLVPWIQEGKVILSHPGYQKFFKMKN